MASLLPTAATCSLPNRLAALVDVAVAVVVKL